jgi:hypothetical protein
VFESYHIAKKWEIGVAAVRNGIDDDPILQRIDRRAASGDKVYTRMGKH